MNGGTNTEGEEIVGKYGRQDTEEVVVVLVELVRTGRDIDEECLESRRKLVLRLERFCLRSALRRAWERDAPLAASRLSMSSSSCSWLENAPEAIFFFFIGGGAPLPNVGTDETLGISLSSSSGRGRVFFEVEATGPTVVLTVALG